MVDPHASPETQTLYANLRRLARTQVLFGQQDALAYGVTWKDWHAWRTDVSDVCGKFPAVFGWDLGKLGSQPRNLDGVDFGHMRNWMRRVFREGGINTVSWHLDNLLTGGDYRDTGKRVVRALLPGGVAHGKYVAKLTAFADFVGQMQLPAEPDVPLIFRPFHEHTGSWFWWGHRHCSREEFIALWRFTVAYLRDEKGLHNLLYAYSPDVFRDRAHYLERYPGDAYVDVLGLDDYHDFGPSGRTTDLVKRLRTVVELAGEKGKVAALTETGLERVPKTNWWTEHFLPAIYADPVASRIAWVMVWRNGGVGHHYGPYPGHGSAEDFRRLAADPRVLFLGEYHDVYGLASAV